MEYNIKNHPTRYRNIQFRSRLEARWAAYFDLLGLYWEYEPIDLCGWSPDFLLDIPCNHSECENGAYGSNHRLLVEIKPYSKISEFKGHPCMDYPYGCKCDSNGITIKSIPADASAAFGINPQRSQGQEKDKATLEKDATTFFPRKKKKRCQEILFKICLSLRG